MGKQISIYLDEIEVRRLTEISTRECRRPIDQVRFILRSVLLGEQSQECNKSVTASNLAERTVNGLVASNPS